MTSVWFNRKFKDDVERRERLYAGEIVVYDCLSAVKEFAEFTARMVETALAPHDPRSIHEVLTPQELAPLLGKLKPQFIHHPESRRLVGRIIAELGGDLDDSHLDVPKLRTAYPTGHLTKGIAFAFAGHRDTWYGAPQAQINWWLPIYPLHADNAMAFYPRYFAAPVENDSDRFSYYRRNVERRSVVEFIDADPRGSALGHLADERRARSPAVARRRRPHPVLRRAAPRHRYQRDIHDRATASIFARSASATSSSGSAPPTSIRGASGPRCRDFTRASDAAAMPEALAQKLDPTGPGGGEVAVFRPGA